MDNNLPINIENLKAGNELAYQLLFNQFYAPLVAYAEKMVGSLDLAREVVQGVIIYIYEHREDLDIQKSLKSYLYKSVYHACLKENKSAMIHQEYAESDWVENRDLIEEAEETAAIWKEINSLPDQCQKVFILNRFEGFKNDQIAEILGISKRTVETHISNALKKLRDKLLSISCLLSF